MRARPDPVGCVVSGVAVIEKNVSLIAKRLRRAAGRRVRIVGTTYPDVILGLWVNGDQASRDLASLSVFAFQMLINPALKRAYATGGARFVDVYRGVGRVHALRTGHDAPALRHGAGGRRVSASSATSARWATSTPGPTAMR